MCFVLCSHISILLSTQISPYLGNLVVFDQSYDGKDKCYEGAFMKMVVLLEL